MADKLKDYEKQHQNDASRTEVDAEVAQLKKKVSEAEEKLEGFKDI